MDRRKTRVRDPSQFNIFNEGMIPPQAIDLEKAILGGLMISKESICIKLLARLKPDVFYKEQHQIIAQAIKNLWEKQITPDILLVSDELRTMGMLEIAGGPYYITMLTDPISSVQNIEFHYAIVYQQYLRRMIIHVSAKASQAAFQDTVDVFDLLEDFIKELDNNSMSKHFRSSVAANDVGKDFIDETCNEDISNADVIITHRTNHPRFDEVVTIARNKILLIAGPKKGLKSRFANHLFTTLCEDYKDVSLYWVSLEDSAQDQLRIYLSSKVLVKPKWLRERRFPNSLKPILKQWVKTFQSFDIEFRDKPITSREIVNNFSAFCNERPGRMNICIIDNILSLADRHEFKHDLNAMYDDIYANILECRMITHGLIVPIHHYNEEQSEDAKIDTGYRPKLRNLKGTEAGARVANQVLLTNFPRLYKDLTGQYQGDQKEMLNHIFIVDAGANREDETFDEVALIHYFTNPNYNLFKEIGLPRKHEKEIEPDVSSFIKEFNPF